MSPLKRRSVEEMYLPEVANCVVDLVLNDLLLLLFLKRLCHATRLRRSAWASAHVQVPKHLVNYGSAKQKIRGQARLTSCRNTLAMGPRQMQQRLSVVKPKPRPCT